MTTLEHSPRHALGSQAATAGELWGLVFAGLLLVAGVFSDGYAHSNFVDELESFLTPWHAAIFAGYLACLAVVARAVQVRRSDGRPWVQAFPPGWKGAVVGVGLFAAGFVGDGVWHTIYGIEADLEALLSPTHLLMLGGALGVLSAPVSSQWSDPKTAPSWRSVGPTLTAVTLMMALVSFFLVWAWPPANGLPLRQFADFAATTGGEAGDTLNAIGRELGVAAYLIYSVVLMAPLLVLSRRWQLPHGSVFAITMIPWLGMNAAFMSFFAWQRLIPVAVAAAVVEGFLWRRRMPGRSDWRTIAAGFPLLWVALDMATLGLIWHIAWPPEFVAGTAVAAGFVGYALSVLAHPQPAVRLETHETS